MERVALSYILPIHFLCGVYFLKMFNGGRISFLVTVMRRTDFSISFFEKWRDLVCIDGLSFLSTVLWRRGKERIYVGRYEKNSYDGNGGDSKLSSSCQVS